MKKSSPEEPVDLLNYWAIVVLERLGNMAPTQEQIDLVTLLLFGSVNPLIQIPVVKQTYH